MCIRDRSLDLQDIKKDHFGWVPSCQILKKTQKMTNSKSPKFHEKLKHLTTFWTLFSQISHADACVAWRRASKEQFTWLLEQILAQSNYRACWIFGSTPVQILVPFSILFGEYLEIYPLDLDDFQNVPRHLIILEACSLRLATAFMYMTLRADTGSE